METYRDVIEGNGGRNRRFVNRIEDDPFYLNSSDHPGMVLTTTLLTETNYLQWNMAIEMALGAKLKLGFVNGSIPQPVETDESYQIWLRVDRMVRSWLINSMSKELTNSALYAKSAKALWDDLRDRFGDSHGPMIYKLQRDISNFSQGSLTITMYYSKLKSMWDELECLVLTPYCTCNAAQQVHNCANQYRLMQFLMGLNDGFDATRNQILLIDPMLTVSKAYSMLLRVEKQTESPGVDISEQSAYYEKFTNGSPSSGGQGSATSKKDKGPRYCDFCKKDNHTRDPCFKLNGEPDWYKAKMKGKRKPSGYAYNVGPNVVETPFDFADESSKDGTLLNKQEVAELIKHELSRFMSHSMNAGGASGKTVMPPLTGVGQSQSVNFVHGKGLMTESAGKTLNLLSLWGGGDRLKVFKAGLQDEGSYDEAVKDCDGVFHVAASMEFNVLETKDIESYVQSHIIDPAIKGTTNLLRSCLKSNSVKRVVFTSSISTLSAQDDKGQWKQEVDESCQASVHNLWKTKANGWVYALAKLLTEEAAFKYAKENGIDLVSVISTTVAGNFLTSSIPASIQFLLSPLSGDSSFFSLLSTVNARRGSTGLVHIEDICNAHLFLMEQDEAEGRYLCNVDSLTMPELIDHLVKEYPSPNVRNRFSGEIQDSAHPEISSKKLRDLGFVYKHDIEDIIHDTITSCVDRGFLAPI